MTEASKVAQKSANQATQATKEMATGKFSDKKTAKPRQRKPRATGIRRATDS